MKRGGKRMLAVLLALMMLVSLGVGALADGEYVDASDSDAVAEDPVVIEPVVEDPVAESFEPAEEPAVVEEPVVEPVAEPVVEPSEEEAAEEGLPSVEAPAQDGAPLGVPIDAAHFPDDDFRNFILNKGYDTDSDTYLSDAELAAVTEMDCSYEYIVDLTGIEYFTSLKELDCSGNELTSLDASANTALTELLCGYNKLTSLDVSKNIALQTLFVFDNQLATLDLSKNTALTVLRCQDNQLTSLDVSSLAALVEFECESNKLTSLDVSACAALDRLICGENQLSALDVNKNTALTILSCEYNQLTSLNVSNLAKLEKIFCSENQLVSLEVTSCPGLHYLECFKNSLTSLDVSSLSGLWELYCQNNQLTELNISGCTELNYLECYGNQLTSLDVSATPLVKESVLDGVKRSTSEYDGYGSYPTTEYFEGEYIPSTDYHVKVDPGMPFNTIASYTVTFDANGGMGTMAPVTVTEGEQLTLPENGFTAEEGYEFDKWDAGVPGEKIDVTADMTVKAVWKEIPVVYTFVSGDGGEWTKGSTSELEFIVKRNVKDTDTYLLFKDIEMDGQVVDTADYGIAAGSAVITLKPAYLEKLSTGSHTLKVNFADGSAETSFTVKAAQADNTAGTDTKSAHTSRSTAKRAPNTGDGTAVALWSFVLIVSTVGLGVVLTKKRKEKFDA